MKKTCKTCRHFNGTMCVTRQLRAYPDNGSMCISWKSRAGRKKKNTVRIGKEVICDDVVTCSTDYKPTDWADKFDIGSVKEYHITLRDFYAGCALHNSLKDMKEYEKYYDDPADKIIKDAFWWADAMLKARERK